MEKEITKFELRVIENNNKAVEHVTNPLAKAKVSNPMMAKFLEFRQAKRMTPKDLI